MKTFIYKLVSRCATGAIVLMALLSLSTQKVEAATPTLTITNAGNNQVRIEVNGDVYSSVFLYFYNPPNSGSIQSAGNIGTTNSSGYFTTTVSNTAYGIPVGTNVFVNVNNQQSSSVLWPTITGGNIYLSQTNVWTNVNQNTTVTVSGGTGTYYISSNSNSNVATASISGSVITIYGVNSGNTTLTICSASSGTSCTSLYVNVGGGYYGGQYVSLNPSSVNVQAGQNQSVSISGSGSYYLSGSSNSGIASVTINGSTLNVYGIANGSTSFTVCSQTNNGSCATLYVTVYTSYNNGYYNNYYNGNSYNNMCYSNGNYYNCNNYNNYSGNYYQPPVVYQQPVVYTQPVITQTYGRPVAGVYLNQIPSTGIKIDLKLVLFVVGLALWSLFIANIFVSKSKKSVVTAQNTLNSGKNKAHQFKIEQMRKKGLLR